MSASLTAFDVIVLLIVGATFLYALIKGFTTMLLTVAAWGGAVLVTLYAMAPASRFARTIIEPPTLADFVALPVLFIGSLVVFKLTADFVGRRVRSSPVGMLDRSLGAALGLTLGAVLVSAGYLFFSSMLDEERHPEWMQTARTKPLVAYGAAMVARIGPELAARAEETPEGDRLIEHMRESYTAAGKKARELSETAYEDMQRRLMDQKMQQLMEAPPEPRADAKRN